MAESSIACQAIPLTDNGEYSTCFRLSYRPRAGWWTWHCLIESDYASHENHCHTGGSSGAILRRRRRFGIFCSDRRGRSQTGLIQSVTPAGVRGQIVTRHVNFSQRVEQSECASIRARLPGQVLYVISGQTCETELQ